MIGISVIDISIDDKDHLGHEDHFHQGFYVVILKKEIDIECIWNQRKMTGLYQDSNITLAYYSSY